MKRALDLARTSSAKPVHLSQYDAVVAMVSSRSAFARAHVESANTMVQECTEK